VPTLSCDELSDLMRRVLSALGCPGDEAEVIARSLALANLAGHDSHGLIRIEQYVKMVQIGEAIPGAPVTVEHETACTAVLNGGWNFGQVAGRRAAETAIRKAREYGTGTVTLRNSNHLGRLGEYTLMAAEEGMAAVMMVNNHGRGNLVAPFGGSDGRLSTNPISFAAPGPERPILVDITTSVVAEGKVRIKRNAGQAVPEGWLIDSQGRATTDPNDLYLEPRGAILPFGGVAAHKGFALSMMVDILSGALSGAGCSRSPDIRNGNAVFYTAIDVEKFIPREEFLEHVAILERHVKASPPAPGFTEVLLPGEPEFREEQRRRREGVRIDEGTWRQFCDCAEGLGIDLSETKGRE